MEMEGNTTAQNWTSLTWRCTKIIETIFLASLLIVFFSLKNQIQIVNLDFCYGTSLLNLLFLLENQYNFLFYLERSWTIFFGLHFFAHFLRGFFGEFIANFYCKCKFDIYFTKLRYFFANFTTFSLIFGQFFFRK